jgi:uncharacterized membrane protein YdbT with pleckstrin-like domain
VKRDVLACAGPACHHALVVSKSQLGPGERVELAVRQHIKALFGPILVFLVTCAAVGVLLAVAPDDGSARTIVQWLVIAAGVLVVGRFSLWPFLNWLTSTYTITSERLLTSHGVFRRYGRTMPLSRVNDVSFDRGVLDRILGCGTLVVSSAGEMGQLELPDVPHVETVQRTIYQLVEAEADRARAAIRVEDAPENRET